MRYVKARIETEAVGKTQPRSIEVRVTLNDLDPAYPRLSRPYRMTERQRYCVVRSVAVAVAHREFSVAVTTRPRR